MVSFPGSMVKETMGRCKAMRTSCKSEANEKRSRSLELLVELFQEEGSRGPDSTSPPGFRPPGRDLQLLHGIREIDAAAPGFSSSACRRRENRPRRSGGAEVVLEIGCRILSSTNRRHDRAGRSDPNSTSRSRARVRPSSPAEDTVSRSGWCPSIRSSTDQSQGRSSPARPHWTRHRTKVRNAPRPPGPAEWPTGRRRSGSGQDPCAGHMEGRSIG